VLDIRRRSAQTSADRKKISRELREWECSEDVVQTRGGELPGAAFSRTGIVGILRLLLNLALTRDPLIVAQDDRAGR
jgi:hypothetical protein